MADFADPAALDPRDRRRRDAGASGDVDLTKPQALSNRTEDAPESLTAYHGRSLRRGAYFSI